MFTPPPSYGKIENTGNRNIKVGGFTPINIVIGNKIKKPDFKIFNIQKKCVECENVIFEEMNIKNVKVVNINKNILSISCKNKIISNEIQLRRKDIVDKIKKNTGINIMDIKII